MNMEIALITAHILLIYPKDPSEVKLSFFYPRDPSEVQLSFLPKRSILGKAFIFTQEIHPRKSFLFYPRDTSEESFHFYSRDQSEVKFSFLTKRSIRGKSFVFLPKSSIRGKAFIFTQLFYQLSNNVSWPELLLSSEGFHGKIPEDIISDLVEYIAGFKSP
jgi:hypothetical protein